MAEMDLRKLISKELAKETAEWDKKHLRELDAIILWQLYSSFGMDKKQLRKFYDEFQENKQALLDRYEFEEGDLVWLCTQKLKDIGINLKNWEKQEQKKERIKNHGEI